MGTAAGTFTSWSPRLSRLVTTVVLVIVNLIPVALLLSGAWRSGDIMIAYWIENIAVGFWAAVQISTARGRGSGTTSRMRITIGNTRSMNADDAPRGVLVGFFCLHYGLFTLVHGVFVLVITFMAGGVTGSLWSWAMIAAAMFVSHGLSTAVHWFGQGERDRISGAQAMVRPYGRIVVLQVAVIGGFLLMGLATDGWQDDGGLALPVDVDPVVLPGLLLIALKLILDVGTHLLQHRRAAAPTGTPTVPPSATA